MVAEAASKTMSSTQSVEIFTSIMSYHAHDFRSETTDRSLHQCPRLDFPQR